MQLIMSPMSPFVRFVRVAIRELGLDTVIEEIQTDTTAYTTPDQLRAANPLGKIPTLVRDDGPALYDSRVIVRYLDAAADGGLYPDGRLWEVLTLEATAIGIADSAVLMVYEGRLRPEDKRHPEFVEAQWAKVAAALDAIETRWISHLAGPLDAASIATACALGYIDFRHPERNWRQGRPSLAAWEAAFADRPAIRDTAPA